MKGKWASATFISMISNQNSNLLKEWKRVWQGAFSRERLDWHWLYSEPLTSESHVSFSIILLGSDRCQVSSFSCASHDSHAVFPPLGILAEWKDLLTFTAKHRSSPLPLCQGLLKTVWTGWSWKELGLVGLAVCSLIYRHTYEQSCHHQK